jgi:hypothetical protein
MKSRCRIVVYGLVLSLSYFQTNAGSATPLKPGTTAHSISKSGPVKGTVLFSTNADLSTPSFSGILSSSVLMNDPNNHYGGLTFTYQLTCDAVANIPVSSISINGFGDYLTSVSYELPLNGMAAPIRASRTKESFGVGTTIDFDFLTGLKRGQSSACLVIQTSDKSCTWNSDSACFGSCSTYAICPIPEPASNKVLTFGLATLGCSHRLVRKLT